MMVGPAGEKKMERRRLAEHRVKGAGASAFWGGPVPPQRRHKRQAAWTAGTSLELLDCGTIRANETHAGAPRSEQ